MNLAKFRENHNIEGGETCAHSNLEIDKNISRISCASVASDLAVPCNRAIAQERLRFELEFASEPDFDAIERSLQILKEQHDADQAIVSRVIALMAEEGAA